MSGGLLAGARLVVSLVPRDLDALERALEHRAHRGADVVEVRLDGIAESAATDNARLARLLSGFERPVIAALHGAEGFGGFGGSAGMRQSILLAARAAGADYIDLDVRFAGTLGDLAGPRILSSHDVAPDAASLDLRAGEARLLRAHPDDLVKVVPAARTAADALAVLRWLEAQPAGSTIAFASGEVASFSRLLAPAYGSALVYAAPSLEPGRMERIGLALAAPGQLTVEHVRRVWPEGAPTASTGVAAVCGRPIDHSASPVTHGAALRAAGRDAMMVPIAPESLGEVADFAAGDRRWVGLAVTAPFKAEAAACAQRDPATEALGAANTLCVAGGTWRASNTDVPAVQAALVEAGVTLEGAEAVVVGAGGAGRAAAQALVDGGATVTVAARRPEATREFTAAFGAAGAEVASVVLGSPEAEALRPSVVVHTTPVGTGGRGDAPVPDAWLGPGCAVFDAVYKPARTSLLERAAAKGAVTVEGTRWFLHQALLQHAALFDASADPEGAARRRADLAMAGALERWTGERHSPGVLCLVGLRGSGKTTIGQAAAGLLGADWLDLDDEIARAEGAADAAEVIETRGLEGFRDAEQKALARVLAADRPGAAPLVLSAGGGVCERWANVEALVERARCVWLDASLDRLRERVARDGATRRPALVGEGQDEFAVLDARRRQRFDRLAGLVLDTAGADVETCAARIAEHWPEAR